MKSKYENTLHHGDLVLLVLSSKQRCNIGHKELVKLALFFRYT